MQTENECFNPLDDSYSLVKYIAAATVVLITKDRNNVTLTDFAWP